LFLRYRRVITRQCRDNNCAHRDGAGCKPDGFATSYHRRGRWCARMNRCASRHNLFVELKRHTIINVARRAGGRLLDVRNYDPEVGKRG